MRRGKFERFHRSDGKFEMKYYFRLKAGNGEIIAQSEGYNTAAARDKGIRSVRLNALTARVVNESEYQ